MNSEVDQIIASLEDSLNDESETTFYYSKANFSKAKRKILKQIEKEQAFLNKHGEQYAIKRSLKQKQKLLKKQQKLAKKILSKEKLKTRILTKTKMSKNELERELQKASSNSFVENQLIEFENNILQSGSYENYLEDISIQIENMTHDNESNIQKKRINFSEIFGMALVILIWICIIALIPLLGAGIYVAIAGMSGALPLFAAAGVSATAIVLAGIHLAH
jgi:hypothetical protein